ASSLTDLMTSLAVIFILLLVAMLNNQRQQTSDRRTLVQLRLKKALLILETSLRNKVEVKPDPQDPLVLLVIVPGDLLNFEQGQYKISGVGFNFLNSFAPLLVSTACSTELLEGISLRDSIS